MESGETHRDFGHVIISSCPLSSRHKKAPIRASVRVESAVGPRRPLAETASRGRRPLNLNSRMRGNG
jgi:hypothetical protein